ncbi:MAG: response regulator [Candidatus Aminicenantes bacterium]|nr:response regulator [Candidatus Aminicenantes bacterium]
MPEPTPTILLVEDELIIAIDEQKQLEEKGYTVFLEATGEKAVEFVRNQSARVDLILMDINLGRGMDGTQAAREILREYNIPVLFLSAHTDPGTIEKTENVSSYGFVVKTSGIAVLSASIRMAINLHRALRELQLPEEAPGPEDYADEFLPPAAAGAGKADAIFSLSMFQAALESTADAILIVAQGGTISGYNTQFAKMWGIPEEILAEKNEAKVLDFVSDQLADPDDFLERVREAYRHPDKDGFDLWQFKDGRLIESYSRPQSMGGKPVGRVWSCRDVTARTRMEEELRQAVAHKEILMKEIRHRIKNSLAIVSGLITMETDNLTDPKCREIFINTRARILSVSSIYEQLDRSTDPGIVDLRALITHLTDSLVKTYAPDAGRFVLKTSLDEILLDTKRAFPMVLILNELITNAIKYAYPEGAGGEIRIDLRKPDGKILLRVEDDGAGLPEGIDPNTAESTGLSLIRMLADQIDAGLTFKSKGGVKVSLELAEKA